MKRRTRTALIAFTGAATAANVAIVAASFAIGRGFPWLNLLSALVSAASCFYFAQQGWTTVKHLGEGRYEATLTLGPPHPKVAATYARWDIPAPKQVGYSSVPPGFYDAVAHPWADRAFHEQYAHRNGFFWLPCPRCGVPFGGHEISYGTYRNPNGSLSSMCTPCSAQEAHDEARKQAQP